jgi:hypothetical protein
VANFPVKNGLGNDKFLKASGAGTDLDPQIPEHKETSATAIAASANSLDAKTPALGQALAGASTPVVLPAAQITALTPPAPITGYATAANQASGNASLIDLLTALASLLTELQLKANLDETQPVSFGTLPLPTGAATQATLASLLTELQAKANLTQTQPISAASLPLPAGAASQATLSSILTELSGKADLTETQPVSVAAMPLPTGAATQTTLASLLTELQGKADLGETQPISAATLPLPAGASTAASQSTGNTSLSNIDTKTPALGQALAAASIPVVLTAAQQTALTPPAAITGYATSANQTTGNTSIGSIDTKTPALGQALAAGSVPVVLPVAQITTLTPPAAITGYATETTLGSGLGAVTETAPSTDTASSGVNGRLQRLAQKLTSLIALFPTSVGQKAKSAALAVTLASDEDLLVINGSVTETAPGTDTASSGLNGRLQRIAQRLTSLIALLPASLGQKTKSASLAVTLASDEDLLTRQGSLTETAPATDTASSGINGRLQRLAQNATTGNGTLASLLTELQLKADLTETQPISAGSLPLPTGASTETTLNSLYNAFGQASATAWSGLNNGSHMQIMKAIYGLLAAALTFKMVDSGGVAISSSNPLQVQQAQLLASQDSVQANVYAMGDSGAAVAVRVPTAHATNLSTSLAANSTATLVAAPATGLKNYAFHVRVSMEVGSNVAGMMGILNGTGGTILTRFRIVPGQQVDLWFPNGTLQSTAATLLAIKNLSGATLTNLEWGVDYAVGA